MFHRLPNVGNDFPVRVIQTPFTKSTWSYSPSQLNTRNIIISKNQDSYEKIGKNEQVEEFFEIITNENTNNITYKSFKHDYNKKLAILSQAQCGIDCTREQMTQSYLVRNNKYIVVFKGKDYNVYDIKNDKWLLLPHAKQLIQNWWQHAQSLLLNDEIIVVHGGYKLCFYSIRNNDIIDPKFIGEHIFESEFSTDSDYGMCCIECDAKNKQLNNNNNNCNNYNAKIMLFGCNRGHQILSSHLVCNLTVQLTKKGIGNENHRYSIQVEEEMIKEDNGYNNDIKKDNTPPTTLGKDRNRRKSQIIECQSQNFGYECIFNVNKEAIIVIVGGQRYRGDKEWERSVLVYNTVTKKSVRKDQVKITMRDILF